MTTIKGVYENGVVTLLENAPVSGSQKVLITFIEDNDEDLLRSLSFYKNTESFQNYLEDNNEDLYQDYLKK